MRVYRISRPEYVATALLGNGAALAPGRWNSRGVRLAYTASSVSLAMLEILKSGGLQGGLNFDAKNRRPSYTHQDMFEGFILGMDSFALGLIKAVALIEDGRIDQFVKERYASFDSELGRKIRAGKATLEELSKKAVQAGNTPLPGSGKQEYLENIINRFI